MSNETYVTINGTMVADPEVRFTPSGGAVANFRVAVNARKFDKQTNEWKKQPPKFWSCNAWNQGKALLAENVAEALKKGDTVLVYGELVTREYETKEGEKRSVDEIRVEAVGKDLRWHSKPATPAASTGTWNAPAEDPWANSGGGFGGQGAADSPPF